MDSIPPKKSIRSSTPSNVGGVNARIGFAFQDHVAASKALEMLQTEKLKEVWCETYDDICLIWADESTTELVEYVQVKNESLEQLYSVAQLCSRDSGPGTSLLERSLARDEFVESARFRLVTSTAINSDLKVLAVKPEDRALLSQALAELKDKIKSKPAGDSVSPNSNDISYWVDNTYWEVCTALQLGAQNRIALGKVLETMGAPVYSDTIEEIYGRLLWRVKSAAEACPRAASKDKVLVKDELKLWLLEQSHPIPAAGTISNLKRKLSDANQPDDTIEEAIEMRQRYNTELRRPTYLTSESINLVSEKVRGVLHQLKAKMDMAELSPGGGFHLRCVDEVIAVKDDCEDLPTKPPEGILLGCMYEITSRCRHRFTRPRA